MSFVKVENLTKDFYIKENMFVKHRLRAVENITFEIQKGDSLGLVGESGCGKSTVGRCILRLIEPTSGNVWINGTNIVKLKHGELRKFRSNMQMVFQDPGDALNPRMTLRQTLKEVLRYHTDLREKQIDERILHLLQQVGLKKEHLDRYPHEFSGGQKQRIGFARAISTGAQFIVMDEPTSALDTSVKGQILSLMIELKQKFKLTYLFITHDLSVLRYICSNIAVMYLGRIVEVGTVSQIFNNPIHPYTKALMSAVPIPDPKVVKKRIKLIGEIPSPINLPKGCRLAGRCPLVDDVCKEHKPPLEKIDDSHYVACWKLD